MVKMLFTIVLAIGVGLLILGIEFDSKVYKQTYRPITTWNELMDYLGDDFEEYKTGGRDDGDLNLIQR